MLKHVFHQKKFDHSNQFQIRSPNLIEMIKDILVQTLFYINDLLTKFIINNSESSICESIL